MAQPQTLPFRYTRLDPEQHSIIRLITVLPPPAQDKNNSSPIRCLVDHVAVCRCHLLPGATLTTRFPTVNFHHFVRNRPQEVVETPHSLNLEKEKLVPKAKSPAKREPNPRPDVSRSLYIEGIAQMLRHPEDTGGGFSTYWPMESDDADYDDGGDIRRKRGFLGITKLGHKLRRGVRKMLTPTPQPVQPPVRDRPQLQLKWDWGTYVALSYEWGPPEPNGGTEIFVCNRNPQALHEGNTDFGLLRIRKNLVDALRQLRTMAHFAAGVPLWIDALSINQQDEDEIALQLPLMSHIYNCAGNVLVWLGTGNKRLCEQGVDLVQDFGKWYRTEYQEAYDDDESQPWRAHVHRNSAEVTFRQMMGMWKASATADGRAFWADEGQTVELLYDFFKLGYWRRLWMVQELAMGTTDMAVLIGNRVTEWRYVRDTAFALAAIGDVFAESLPGIELPQLAVCHVARIAQLEIEGHRKQLPPADGMPFGTGIPVTQVNSGPRSGPLRGQTLWQAFRVLHLVECFQPKDRVYGMLALPGLPDLGIKPDPKKQSTVTVFTAFAVGCAKASFRDPLGYFCLIDGATTGIDGDRLPSWVPDLSSGRRTGIIEGIYRAGDKYTMYQLMGFEDDNCEPELIFDGEFGGNFTLQALGFVIDAIDGLGAISSLDPDFNNSRMKPDLFQPRNAPGWPVEEMTPSAAIASCFVAGADENGTRLPVKGEETLLTSFSCPLFIGSDYSNDLFFSANKDLRINGESVVSYALSGPVDCRIWDQREDGPKIKALRQTMLARTKRKRLAVTEKGYVGLVPNSVEVGDVIIIIKGHGRPVVASPALMEGSTVGFRLKGEAYVEGMMGGEMEDEHRKTLEMLSIV
jgi:hypothetical protein